MRTSVPWRNTETSTHVIRKAILRHAGRGRGDGVLVADDEQDARRFVQLALEEVGYHVTLAASGSEALSCLTEKCYDVVVLDVRMPDMDGLNVLAHIRALDMRQPVLLISGVASFGETSLGKRLGATYMRKPLVLTDLWTTIGSLQRTDGPLTREPGLHEKRRHARVELDVRTRMRIRRHGKQHMIADAEDVRVGDTSIGGMLVEFAKPVECGDIVTVILESPEIEGPVECLAEVVRIDVNSAGLRLQDADDASLDRLYSLVVSRLLTVAAR